MATPIRTYARRNQPPVLRNGESSMSCLWAWSRNWVTCSASNLAKIGWCIGPEGLMLVNWPPTTLEWKMHRERLEPDLRVRHRERPNRGLRST